MGKVLGIDYGRRRVGVAAGDSDIGLSTPRETLTVRDVRDAVTQVAGLCAREEPGVIVVGLPLNMDGSAGPMAAEVRDFMAQLRERTGLKVVEWDERLSSAEAERVLLAGDVSREGRRRVRDKLAAAVILQAFLDSGPVAEPEAPLP
jgi:putative Holliday junction resolvase